MTTEQPAAIAAYRLLQPAHAILKDLKSDNAIETSLFVVLASRSLRPLAANDDHDRHSDTFIGPSK